MTLRTLFSLQWYAFSDLVTTYKFCLRPIYCVFAGLEFVQNMVLDQATIWCFRYALETCHGAAFCRGDYALVQAHGLVICRGATVDVAMILAPRLMKDPISERDREMKPTKKGNKRTSV